MKRNSLNFWIDLISLILLLGLAWTGLLMYYVMPPGTGGGGGSHGEHLWGIGRHDFGTIHFYCAIAMVVLMIIHLALHWSWVCATLKGLLGITSGTPTGKRFIIYGLIFLAIIALTMYISLSWAKSQVQAGPGGRGGPPFSSEHELQQINGRISLAEAAKTANVSVEELIRQLNLPVDVDVDETLGRLGRRYGFEVSDVRRILEKYEQSGNSPEQSSNCATSCGGCL